MAVLQVWRTILRKLYGNELEFPTAPKIKKDPVWFSASTDSEFIYINQAVKNKPSSKLSMQRKLSFKTFEKVYPLCLRRENGEQVSSKVTRITVDQVYYFSIIKHLAQ